MQDYIKDLHVARLLANCLTLEQDNLLLDIVNPTNKVLYLAQREYAKSFEECQESGTLLFDHMIGEMVKQGLWNNVDEKRIQELKDSISSMKMEIFKNWIKTGTVKLYKKQVRRAEKEIIGLLTKKNAYHSMTCEGISTYNRWIYLVEHCTFLGEAQYNFADLSPEEILNYWQNNTLNDSELRELSKYEGWMNVWCSSNKVPFVFPLSEEQQRLIMWSRMYDNIRESSEAPVDEIMEDDDALDGWILVQRSKMNKERTTKMVEDSINVKNSKHAEVFIPVGSSEEAKRIFDLNNPQGAHTVKSRMEQVKNSTGEVKQAAFSDVKFSRMLQANNQEAAKARGM